MRNYFNYFTEVEEYFVRRRGKNLLISPLDWCLVELWKNSGIPLQVVFRGIDRSFEATKKRVKKPPTTLFYCHPAVMESFEQYQESMLGSREVGEEEVPGELTVPEVLQYLQDLQGILRERHGEAFERAQGLIAALKSELETHIGTSLEDVDRSLGRVGAILADSLTELLPRERLKHLKKKVRKDLRIYRKRLSEEAYGRLQEGYLQRCVREEFDVPEFSLFQILESE